jgi:hypothetical protein
LFAGEISRAAPVAKPPRRPVVALGRELADQYAPWRSRAL